MDEIIEINDKIEINDHHIDEPHNENPITMIEVSPNESYLVSHSDKDGSMVGWNIENVDDKDQFKSEFCINLGRIIRMCVSDDMKLACITSDGLLEIYDNFQKVELNCHDIKSYEYCIFNLRGELILYNTNYKNAIILIFSTQDNKWNCKRIYMIPEHFKDFKFISITKYDKLYLFFNNSVYEFNLITGKSKKILTIEEEIKYGDVKLISSNEIMVCLKIKNKKVIIYSYKLKIPFVSLDINNVDQLCKLMGHPALFSLLSPLLFSLFHCGSQNSSMKGCLKKCIGRLKRIGQSPKEIIPYYIRATKRYTFGILDGEIWNINLEIMKKVILSKNYLFIDENDEDENWYFDNDVKIKENNEEINKAYNHLNIFLFSDLYMSDIRKLLKEVISKYKPSRELDSDLVSNNYWNVTCDNVKKNIRLNFYKNDLLFCKKVEVFKFEDNLELALLGIKLFSDNEIIILTQVGLLIYHFNEDDRFISLIYFYKISLLTKKSLSQYNKKLLSESILPLPNYESFECNVEWVSFVKNDKKFLLKYGVELLKFAIKKRNLELVDEIYKKCLGYFKEDFSDKIYLSIITSAMPLLDEYYQEYIERYSLETSMIIDSPSYSIEYHDDNLHLFSFQYPQIVNLSNSVLYIKYLLLMNSIEKNYKKMAIILNSIQSLMVLLILPFYFSTFYVISTYNLFNNIISEKVYSNLYFKVLRIISKYNKTKNIPTLVFMNPYIKFVNYPKDYNWFMEFIYPQPSPFVETINRDIYKTWNGESLINFKWENYGKYYYAIIWIGFMAFLGCFITAATIQDIDNDIQRKLLIASIILGFIHLSFEIRQIIYDPIKWIQDFWNIFDVIAYVLPIYTSIFWLQTNEKNNTLIPFLSFSCLFLDLKFLLFFRAIEYFGVYFAIIISVGKQIISFLVVLFIIIISFAHAFYILLVPKSPISFTEYANNNDPNNPWNIASTYNQVFENGTINSNPYIIQLPNENTNMFIDFRTSLFAMYQFLTGDASAFSNWSYTDPTLAVLIVLFSLLIVVYLMNLLIGLLSNAIEENNNRVSFLIQKAEILAEIELFYLLPHQRRWKEWFPEEIYYCANVDKTHKEVNDMIKDGEWNTKEFPKLKENLMEKLNVQFGDETSLQRIVVERK